MCIFVSQFYLTDLEFVRAANNFLIFTVTLGNVTLFSMVHMTYLCRFYFFMIWGNSDVYIMSRRCALMEPSQ